MSTRTVPSLCGDKPLHFFPRKGNSAGNACFGDYHLDSFFGLSSDERTVANSSTRWAPPIVNLKTGASNSESSPTS
jgi:hypothetical protein